MNFGMGHRPASYYAQLNQTPDELYQQNQQRVQGLQDAQANVQTQMGADRQAAIGDNWVNNDFRGLDPSNLINQSVARGALGQPSFDQENRTNWQTGLLPGQISPQMDNFNATWGNEITHGPNSSGTWVDSQNKAFNDFMQNRQQDITRQQQAYQQQQGGSATGGIVPQNYSTPFGGQITGQPDQASSMPTNQNTPGFGGPFGSAPVDQYNRPGGFGGLGGMKGEWGGPFARNNPFASS